MFTVFLFLIFSLPLLTIQPLLVRPMLLPAVVLWAAASALLFFLFTARGKAVYFHGGIILIGSYFAYEITRDITSAIFIRSLFGDARGPFLSVLTSLSLFVVYLVAVQYSGSHKRIKIIMVAAASLSIAGFIAILQHFVQLPFFLPTVRAYATFPNPLELAGTSLLVLGILGSLISSNAKLNTVDNILLKTALLILSLAIISTLSKIAIFLLAILLVLWIGRLLWSKHFHLAILMLAVSIIALIVYVIPVNPKYATESKFGATELSTTGVASSMSERGKIWKTAALMWASRPVIGWGQADFPTANIEFVRQRKGEKEIWFDVHNFVLDLLVKGGVIKLLLVLAIAFYFFRKITSQNADVINSSLMSGILVYFIYLLFNPSYQVSKVYLFAMLGLISIPKRKIEIPKKLMIILIPLFFTFLIFNLYSGSMRLYAEFIGSKGVKAAYLGDFDKGIIYSKKASSIFPYETDYWSRLGWSYKMRYRFKGKSKRDLLNALAAYKQGLKLVPNDITIKEKIAELKKELRSEAIDKQKK